MSTHYCSYPRNVGPAPVDDPAPYRRRDPEWERHRTEQIQRQMQEAQLASMVEKSAERRLTIAAQFMSGQVNATPGKDLPDLAATSLRAADALLAAWKFTTPAWEPPSFKDEMMGSWEPPAKLESQMAGLVRPEEREGRIVRVDYLDSDGNLASLRATDAGSEGGEP